MAHSVEHHLGDRLLAFTGLERGLVIDRRRQAIDRLGSLGARLESERRRRRIGGDRVRHHRVDPFGLCHAEMTERQRRRGRDVQPRPARRPDPQPRGAVRIVTERDFDHAQR